MKRRSFLESPELKARRKRLEKQAKINDFKGMTESDKSLVIAKAMFSGKNILVSFSDAVECVVIQHEGRTPEFFDPYSKSNNDALKVLSFLKAKRGIKIKGSKKGWSVSLGGFESYKHESKSLEAACSDCACLAVLLKELK